MKVKFHYSFLIGLIICIYLGVYKELLMMFFLISIHEVGHIIVASVFHQKTTKITITIFGGITDIEENTNNIKNIIVYCSGVFVNFVIFLFSSYLPENINEYNRILLFFNLLPVYPLDGYLIVFSLIKEIMNIRKIFKILSFIGLSIILFLSIYSIYLKSLGLLIISIFLLCKNIENMQNSDLIYIKSEINKYRKKANYSV